MSSFHGQTRPDIPRIPQDLTTLATINTLQSRTSIAKVIKSVDEIIQSDTGFTNDTELFVPVEASTQYFGQVILYYQSDVTAGIKMRFTAPAGVTGNRLDNNWGVNGFGTLAFGVQENNATDGNVQVASFHFEILTDVTAGNFIVQWAQIVSQAIDTTMLAGSSLIIWRSEL